MVLRAVIFDLDGTLIDSVGDIAAALNRMLTARGLPPVDAEMVKPLVSFGARDIIKRAFGKAASTLDIEKTFAEFQSTYRSIPPDPSCLFPHAIDMLKELRRRKLKIGVCTNKPEDNAQRIMSGIGLDPLVDVLAGRRDGVPPKPDPTSVFEILKRLNVAASDTAYVGDNEVDAETAKAANLPFVLVSFGYPSGKLENIPHALRIDSFHELPEILHKL